MEAGRGNGRRAAAYAPLVDLDPQLADAVLEALSEAGIAAYAAPSEARRAGGIVASPVQRPLDRVYVDTESLDRARTLLQARLPGLRAEHDAPPPPPPATPAATDEAAWSQILAAWEAPAAEPARQTPADPAAAGRPTPEPAAAPPQPPAERRTLPPGRDDGDHFVPPPPPPLPSTDPVTKLAWAGVLGGPLLLVAAVLAGVDLAGWQGLLAVFAFMGGFVTLVARMNDRPADEDDPDDGAVV